MLSFSIILSTPYVLCIYIWVLAYIAMQLIRSNKYVKVLTHNYIRMYYNNYIFTDIATCSTLSMYSNKMLTRLATIKKQK